MNNDSTLNWIKSNSYNDLENNFIGLFFDKMFGFLYGIIFSYFIFSTLLYGMEKFEISNSLMFWLIENSFILENINFELIKMVHVLDNKRAQPCYGLFFELKQKKILLEKCVWRLP